MCNVVWNMNILCLEFMTLDHLLGQAMSLVALWTPFIKSHDYWNIVN